MIYFFCKFEILKKKKIFEIIINKIKREKNLYENKLVIGWWIIYFFNVVNEKNNVGDKKMVVDIMGNISVWKVIINFFRFL